MFVKIQKKIKFMRSKTKKIESMNQNWNIKKRENLINLRYNKIKMKYFDLNNCLLQQFIFKQ